MGAPNLLFAPGIIYPRYAPEYRAYIVDRLGVMAQKDEKVVPKTLNE